MHAQINAQYTHTAMPNFTVSRAGNTNGRRTIKSALAETGYPSFIHDKGNGLALSLYLCGESNGRYDCSEDVNTFRILLEPELISDNRSRSETDLIRRDESRSIERQPITQYSLRNAMRGRISTVQSHGCVDIESPVPRDRGGAKSSGTSGHADLSPTTPHERAATFTHFTTSRRRITGPLLAATTARDSCSPRDDEHHYCRAQTAHNGNPIAPDIGQSGLRLLFTCIPITVISVVPSGDPMGAPATTASYAGRNLRGTDWRLV
ncbi:hypothetical protein Q7P36_008125 [Cladosporium allicinum]